MPELSGSIVTPAGLVPGRLAFAADIATVEPAPGAPARFILPGFIDAHIHGGGGADTMDGPGAIATLSRFHLRHGTTTLLPTTITRPWAEVMAGLRGVAEARAIQLRGEMPGAARIHGAHLEGPFVNPARLGAQPPFALDPDPARVAEAVATGILRIVTMAPEQPGAGAAIRTFVAAGIRVSFGHSAADYACASAAIAAIAASGGVAGGTHLFNAMGGIEGRAPGLPGALLASPVAHAELILDTHHVHPGSFRLAHAALGRRLLLITDAMRGAGTVDGDSELGGQPVHIRGGVARLANGSLAGSVLTMDAALRNAVAAGTPLPEAAALASTNAAAYLGLHDRGIIAPGRRADLVVLDAGLHVEEVWVGGERQA